MATISETLKNAQARAREMDLPYEGAVTPQEAYQLLREAPEVKLVDVRTRAERDWVGRIPGAIEIEWLTYPGNQTNPNFAAQLEAQVDPESLVMFICRSGGRSSHAAATAAQMGYTQAFNVLEGFEGDKDQHGHRSTIGGWKHAGLPWLQS
jgi:rhodanese-related sulfurtransferase